MYPRARFGTMNAYFGVMVEKMRMKTMSLRVAVLLSAVLLAACAGQGTPTPTQIPRPTAIGATAEATQALEATEAASEATAAASEATAAASEAAVQLPLAATAEATVDPQDAVTEASLGSILDIASANDDFSTLVTALVVADLADTLAGEGPFTVFAPTNEAFAATLDALDLTLAELLAEETLLEQVLTYHVVADNLLASDVVALAGATLTTVQGEAISIDLEGEAVRLNTSAIISAVDILASNGVIHVIDAVLLPPSLTTANAEATAEATARP